MRIKLFPNRIGRQFQPVELAASELAVNWQTTSDWYSRGTFDYNSDAFYLPRIKISTRMKILTTFKLFTLTLRLCWMNHLLKRPRPFLWYSTAVSSVQTISDISIRCLFRPNLPCLFWVSKFRCGRRYTLLERSITCLCTVTQKKKKNWLWITVIILGNFFSLLQRKIISRHFERPFERKELF